MRPIVFLLAAVAYGQTFAPYSSEETSMRTQTRADGTRNETRIVEIVDPTAGVRYILDEPNKVAHRFLLTPHVTGSRVAEVAASDPPVRQSAQESLGYRPIGGIPTEGRRITTTILPAATSNDRLGDTTYAITNISPTAPDHALFQIPADYTIIDPVSSN